MLKSQRWEDRETRDETLEPNMILPVDLDYLSSYLELVTQISIADNKR